MRWRLVHFLLSTFYLPLSFGAQSPATDSLPQKVIDDIAEVRKHSVKGEAALLAGNKQEAEKEFASAFAELSKLHREYSDRPELNEFLLGMQATFEQLQRVHDMAILVTPPGKTSPPTVAEEFGKVDLYSHSIEISPELAGRIQENLEPARYDLRVTLNEDVLSAIDFFLKNRNGRKLMKIGLERIGLYEEEIRRILREAGLPTDLVYLAQLESNFFPNALSSAKAAGLWQFVAETGIRYGLKVDWWVDERNDPYKSTEAATRYLKFLHDQFNDWYLVMASYNTGEGRILPLVRRGLQDFWKISEQKLIARETRAFVPLILAIAIIGKRPGEFGFDVQAAEPERFETIVLERPVSLKVLVRRAGLDLEVLRQLNPELKQDVTPQYSRSYSLRLPPGTLAAVTQRLASLSPRQRMGSN